MREKIAGLIIESVENAKRLADRILASWFNSLQGQQEGCDGCFYNTRVVAPCETCLRGQSVGDKYTPKKQQEEKECKYSTPESLCLADKCPHAVKDWQNCTGKVGGE